MTTKDQKIKSFVNKQMVREFYVPAIKRTIGLFFTKAVNEILGSLTVSSKNLRDWQLEMMKQEIMYRTLKTEKCKQILLFELDSVGLKKDDILAEILKQYGIDSQEQSTAYHDEMSIIFAEVLSRFSSYVSAERYDLIFKEMED